MNNTSTWTTHKVTMDEWMKNALNTPLMTTEEWRAMFDPNHQELTVHCRSEMKHYDHARFDPCLNCGANSWLSGHCEYCGTEEV